MAPKIGIIGAGGVGQALGAQLLKHGRAVRYGVRDPSKPALKEVLAAKEQAGAAALPVKEAVDWADVLILAVPGWRDAAEASAVAASLGPSVASKVVIDATNPLTPFPGLEVLYNGSSGGELLTLALPNAAVYKAFNTVGIAVMQQPDALGSTTMMFAGPAEATARDTVAALIDDAGFKPVYVGPIRYARNLESLAELWIHLNVPPAGFTQEYVGPVFAFQLDKAQTA